MHLTQATRWLRMRTHKSKDLNQMARLRGYSPVELGKHKSALQFNLLKACKLLGGEGFVGPDDLGNLLGCLGAAL